MRSPAVVLVAAFLAAACGVPATPTAATAAPGNDTIFVRDGDVVVAIDGESGKAIRTLGRGVLAEDRKLFHALSWDAGATTVRTVDVATGSVLRSVLVPGEYGPVAYGPTGLSPRGEKLVLQQWSSDARSRFAVIDTKAARVLARVEVPGQMDFDGIDESGSALYLLEHPVPGSIAYNVRLYDLFARELLTRPITDQKIVAEPTPEQIARGTMGGIYAASVMPTSGWHLTLALHPTKGPFVHALNLGARYASCLLDLPSGNGRARGLWAMTLSPDQRWAWVVNPGAGAIAKLDTASLEVKRGMAFPVSAASDVDVDGPRGAAVMSPDGSRLYAVAPRGIVVIDASSMTVRSTYMPDRLYNGLAISADGRRLYALTSAGHAIDRLDAATGRPLGQISAFDGPRALVGAAAR